MMRVENNHICCLQYQIKMLWGRAQLFLTDPRTYTLKKSPSTRTYCAKRIGLDAVILFKVFNDVWK